MSRGCEGKNMAMAGGIVACLAIFDSTDVMMPALVLSVSAKRSARTLQAACLSRQPVDIGRIMPSTSRYRHRRPSGPETPPLQMSAPAGSLHAAGLGRDAHPPAGVSAVRETHDNAGTVGWPLTALQQRRRPTPPRSPRPAPLAGAASRVQRMRHGTRSGLI